MNENITTTEDITPDVGIVPPAAKKRTKLYAWIGAGVAAALVTGGAIAIPQIAHASQVSAYEAAVSELNTVLADTAEAETATDSTVVLGALQHGEAVAFASQVAGFGTAPEHAVTKDQAAALGKAGETATKELGELKLSKADEQLVASAKEKIAQADEKLTGMLPASYLDVSASDITGLLVVPAVSEKVEMIPTDSVDATVLADVEDELAAAQKKLAAAVKDSLAAAKSQEATLNAVAFTLPALEAAGKSLPGTAKLAAEKFTKGGDATGAITAAAETAAKFAAAHEFSTDKDKAVVPAEKGEGDLELTETREAVLLASKIKAYLDGVGSAQAAHDAAVAAEAAAAEQAAAEAAAASGAGGYTSPSGAWVPVAPQGGGWTPGGSTSGGSVSAPPAGGGASTPPAGNGATMNYNPWASQPNGGCPAGTYPSGSWSNVGPGCNANGSNTDW